MITSTITGRSLIVSLTMLAMSVAVAGIAPSVRAARQVGAELVPRVLSVEDIDRYRRILEVQADGRWKEADALIDSLESDILMGHVLFQRYMHPTAYRSKYSELAAWLKNYADHPSAWRVYRLARRRQARAHAPRRPEETRYPGVTGQSAAPKPAAPKRAKAERTSVNRMLSRVRRHVRRGEPERAEKRYWAMHARDILVPHEEADALERIAASYYYKGNDIKARALSMEAARLARAFEPTSDWTAGLAHWRLGDPSGAYSHFDTLARSDRASKWLSAAGHFWAARAALQINRAGLAQDHLLDAAGYTETFYGLIAARQLGLDPVIDWTPPPLTAKAMDKLLEHRAIMRAIALTEIRRDDIADEELRLLWGREGTDVQDALLAFAAAVNLPAIQIRLGRVGGTGHIAPTAVRYPLPEWAPVDGFRIDRALIFAMVRQESDFRTRGLSRAGARGLMQVMPATASYIARDRSLFRRNRNRLYEPEFNMALGQQYIEHLLAEDYVEGNLFMLLAAYNGGPGSLINWKTEVPYEQDPLLFIESIGFYETRIYIERVMANLWLYRMRLGQDTPSLDAIASGAWPVLELLDTADERQITAQRAARLAARVRHIADD